MPASDKEAAAPLLLMAGSSLPFAKEIAANTERRYDAVLKTLREAPHRQPGARVVTADAKSFVEKRATLQQEKTAAGSAGGLIASLGSALGKLTGPQLGIAGGLAGLGIVAGPTLDAWGEQLKDKLVPTNLQNVMEDEGAKGLAKGFGTQTGKSISELLGGLASGAASSLGNVPSALKREGMFSQLKQEDDVLAQADPKALQEAYHTMVRFAPTLATDQNAVRSFLRESVLYGSGPNVVTIKQLADAERASTGE